MSKTSDRKCKKSNLRFIDVATLWYGVKIMQGKFILLISLLLIASTASGAETETRSSAPPPQQEKTASLPHQGCTGCHSDVKPDSNHTLACIDCHRGNNSSSQQKTAHKGMIAAPAAPANMDAACGRCHKERVNTCRLSPHFTLKKAVNTVRRHFGLPALASLTQIPEAVYPPSKKDLINDMLRRQCLRCHVYTAGDNYPYVRRGKGCAACHMQFIEGKLQSHNFSRPSEHQCLSCHYGNHVGSDFEGKYEHDFNWEYRTPYTTNSPYMRPYGVEQHNLEPDIHKLKGLTCIDCHTGSTLSGEKLRIQCTSCHLAGQASALPDNVEQEDGDFILISTGNSQKHRIPQLINPAHEKYRGQVACQVCHAQWSFNDRATHLMLSYLEDVDQWERLTVQSNSAVEMFLEHNLYADEDELSPAMIDSISGRHKPGIWYMGFTQRRWENILIDKDSDGVIKVFRPMLDLRISAVSEDEEVLFDNLTGTGNGLLPYTPHTTGPAGLFYEQRFVHLLHKAQNKTSPGQ
ncbi:MAG: hypothetical protein DSY58_05170 [Desulfobulbus sp.]|nr:MAG: hypothetical protein DSY58_05170 [Desulfobulbus sp.]